MAEQSTMQELGSSAPHFELTDVISAEIVSLESVKSDTATVVLFICNHCPFVLHVIEGLTELVKEYQPKGISFVGINSNDVDSYPEDSPAKMKEYADNYGYTFPYLFDEDQSVARQYGAACTPDFFVYDKELKLAYRGRMDGSSPGNNEPVTGAELKAALDAMIGGQSPNPKQNPSLGCGIKWKDSA